MAVVTYSQWQKQEISCGLLTCSFEWLDLALCRGRHTDRRFIRAIAKSAFKWSRFQMLLGNETRFGIGPTTATSRCRTRKKIFDSATNLRKAFIVYSSLLYMDFASFRLVPNLLGDSARGIHIHFTRKFLLPALKPTRPMFISPQRTATVHRRRVSCQMETWHKHNFLSIFMLFSYAVNSTYMRYINIYALCISYLETYGDPLLGQKGLAVLRELMTHPITFQQLDEMRKKDNNKTSDLFSLFEIQFLLMTLELFQCNVLPTLRSLIGRC